MWWIALSSIILALFYWKFIKPLNYWKDLGIPYSKPWPFVGNFLPVILRQKPFVNIFEDLYTQHPTRSQYYRTRRGRSINGQKWRDMRVNLSPAFTSSKMRMMFTLMSDAAEQFTKHFQKKAMETITLEMKDAFTRYTNDVIATTAFGFKCDSLEERENAFYLMGKKTATFEGVLVLKFFAFGMFPRLMKFLKIPLFKEEIRTFFRRLVMDSIEYREKHDLIRSDMINLLMQTRKGKLKYEESEHAGTGFATVEESDLGKTGKQSKIEWTDDDLTAQALIFFFGGFETSSTLLCFVAYELAVNLDVQAKLQTEIDETLEKCNGKVTYEAITGMMYLDMILSETLRKWPPMFISDRQCVKDYTITAMTSAETDFTVKRNTVVLIPIIGFHHDPKYFPNPMKFDPERFSDENKRNITPQSYMPFGVGPRNCIGSRFALLENKILFFHLLSKFDIVPVEKTTIPLKLSKKKLFALPDNGFWLGLKQRKNKL